MNVWNDSIPERSDVQVSPLPVEVQGIKMYAYRIDEINSINKHLFQLEMLLLDQKRYDLNISNCEKVKDQAIYIANKATTRIGQVEKALSASKIQEAKDQKRIRELESQLTDMTIKSNDKWKWGGIGLVVGFVIGIIVK